MSAPSPSSTEFTRCAGAVGPGVRSAAGRAWPNVSRTDATPPGSCRAFRGVDRIAGAAFHRGLIGAQLRERKVPRSVPPGLWVPVRNETAAVSVLLGAGWTVAPGARFRIADPPGVRVTIAIAARGRDPPLADALAYAAAASGGPRICPPCYDRRTMEMVPVRDLQQHASAVLRRVRAGETVGVTDRGTLMAVLSPPDAVGGAAALVAAGRVRRGTRAITDLPPPVPAARPTAEVLDGLRDER